MRRPSGVIFDFGNTVMCDEAVNLVAGNARLLEFVTTFPHPTAQEIQHVADEIAHEIDRLKVESMLEFNIQSFHRLLFENLGLSFSISYPEMEREFWHAATSYRPSEGILEVLDTLEAQHIKAGILSNNSFSGAVMWEDLAKHNLAHRFSFVISSADYGFRKPSRRIFEIAIKKMGLPPGDIWFVGDRLDIDVAGAIDSGLCPVWYNPRKEPHTGELNCFEIEHWHEFRDRIETFCGQMAP